MNIIISFLLQAIGSVFLKMIYSVASEEVIAKYIFKLLKALANKTKTTKDDEVIQKLEELYYKNSDTVDPKVEQTMESIKSAIERKQ